MSDSGWDFPPGGGAQGPAGPSGVTAGADLAVRSITVLPNSPYAQKALAGTVDTALGVYDWGGGVYNVKSQNNPSGAAKGDGVTDDRASILAAHTAATTAPGGKTYFPGGAFACSDYIDGAIYTSWEGAGCNTGAPNLGTQIIATGTQKGIFRRRPGTPGVITVTQEELHMSGILFTGSGSSTGHLVTLARISHGRFHDCGFSNTNGQGLKDDNATLTGAAGVYAYSCENISFNSCTFANNLNATNGAGVTMEDACHGWSFTDECHFNGNTYDVRSIAITAGNGTAGLYFGAAFFFASKTTFFCDAGGVHTVSCWGCWFEAQTGANRIIDGGTSAGPLINWSFNTCVIQLSAAGTKTIVGGTQMDNTTWQNVRFNGTTTTNLFSHNYVNGGNAFINCVLVGTIANVFVNNDPTTSGFSTLIGAWDVSFQTLSFNTAATAFRQKRVTLTDAATVAVDLALGNDFFLSTALSRAIGNPTHVPAIGYSQWFCITISNTSGGAITTTFGANYHLASAWVDPGTLKQRTIWFRADGTTGLEYEQNRNATDVTP